MKKEEYFARLQKAILFIEQNLHNEISLSEISKVAFSSLSHFHRIFFFMTGFTLKEYIRKRRLSKAAEKILCSNEKIIDIAFDAGYETPESFTRAFHEMFHRNPSDFRKNPSQQELFPSFNFNSMFNLQKEPNQNTPLLSYVLLKETYVLGKKTKTTLAGHKQRQDIPEFFGKCMAEHLIDQIQNKKLPVALFGVYTDMTDEEEFNYTMGCEITTRSNSQNEFDFHTLPACKYARFTVNGPPTLLEEAWRYIYGEWFPLSEQDRAKGYDFEIYGENSTQIYIPLKNF